MEDMVSATYRYEAWLAERLPLVRKHLELKHEQMAEEAFSFLRGTFYRWAQRFPERCSELSGAPRLQGVGDLHIENFGTWRDVEGRLVWGINDFDEAWRVPYTCDLVRLATSALLAIRSERLDVPFEEACEAVCEGYAAGLLRAGAPFVLADRHGWLRDLAIRRLHEWDHFWSRLQDRLRSADARDYPLPDVARRILLAALPEPSAGVELGLRAAGVGSLGRQRFVALLDWEGGRVAREVKQLAPSAWAWAAGDAEATIDVPSHLLERSVRCEDPFTRIREGWMLRRLAPDADKLTLDALREHRAPMETRRQGKAREERDARRACKMLRAMGRETANVHRANPEEALAAVRAHLAELKPGWLYSAARKMAGVTEKDWRAWRRHYRRQAAP